MVPAQDGPEMSEPVHMAPQPHLSSWACPWMGTAPPRPLHFSALHGCVPWRTRVHKGPSSLPSLGSHGCPHNDPPCGTWGCRGGGLWVPRPPGLPLSGEDSAPPLYPGLASAEPESGREAPT